MRSTLRVVALASAVIWMTSAAASATPLIGTFTTVGLGDVRVGSTFIDWAQAGNTFGPTNGDIQFANATGSFGALNLTQGTIHDLNVAANPVGTTFLLNDFLTSNAQPTWAFDLTFINPGKGTPAGCTNAVGDVCTPLGSPFTITNTAGGGSTLSMSIKGTVSDGVGPATVLNGVFTMAFADLTSADILGLVATQGFFQASESASFQASEAPVPEPASMLLFGTGFGAVILRLRRRFVG